MKLKRHFFQKQIDLIRPIKESWMNFTNVEQSNNQFMVKKKKINLWSHANQKRKKGYQESATAFSV